MKRKNHLMFYLTLLICAIMPLGFASFDVHAGETTQATPTLDNTINKVCYNSTTNKQYTTIETALKEAISGETIYVYPSSNGVYINNDCEVKSGVTLSILFEEGQSNVKEANSTSLSWGLGKNPTAPKSKVIISENVVLTNNGSIDVGGIVGAGSGGNYTSYTSSSYSALLLDENAILNNHGILNVYGLIGETTKNNGSKIISSTNATSNTNPEIHMPFLWYDFCGGSALKAIYDSIDSKLCVPLDDFYFENITPELYIYYGTILTGWVNLNAASNYGFYDLPIIGNDFSSIIKFDDQSSYLICNYDEDTFINKMDFYGSASFNALTIDVKKAITDSAGSLAWDMASLAGIPPSVSTTEGYFPLTYHFNIGLHALNNSNAIFNGSNNRYKLMNASNLTIYENVTLNVKNLVVYDGSDYYTDRGTHASSMKKTVIDFFPEKKFVPATCIVNGILQASCVAGYISTTSPNSTIIVDSTVSEMMYEPKNGTGSRLNATMTEWYNITLNLKLNNENNIIEQKNLIGKYISFFENGFYYRSYQKIEEITSVNISASQTSTDAGKSAKISLSAILSPEGYNTPSSINYSWYVENGESLTFSPNNTVQNPTVFIPANESTESDKVYSISLTVTILYDNKESYELKANIIITATKKSEGGSVCLLPNSLITMADGSYKFAKDLAKGDVLLTYNHMSGKFEGQKILANVIYKNTLQNVITLTFSNGNKLEVATGHGLFNVNRNRYEIYYGEEFIEHIGEQYIAINSDNFKYSKFEVVTLIDVKIEKKVIDKFSPVSEYNINCIANNMLTIPDDIEGMFDAYEFSTIENGLKIDFEKFSKYVEIYGVYEYEDVANVLPKYLYDVLNFKYFKTYIGIGVITYDKTNYLIRRYAKQFTDFQGIYWDWENSEPLTPDN